MSNNSIFRNTIKADKNSKLLLEVSNVVTSNYEHIEQINQSIIDLNYAINDINNKIDNSVTITIDNELSNNSENPVQNKIITSTLSNYYNKSDIDTKLSEIQLVGGTGVQYRNSTLAENIAIVDISEISGITNNVSAVIAGKVLPISVIPHDTSAIWRYYWIRGYIYDSESDTTTISIIATDTSTNVDICYMQILDEN